MINNGRTPCSMTRRWRPTHCPWSPKNQLPRGAAPTAHDVTPTPPLGSVGPQEGLRRPSPVSQVSQGIPRGARPCHGRTPVVGERAGQVAAPSSTCAPRLSLSYSQASFWSSVSSLLFSCPALPFGQIRGVVFDGNTPGANRHVAANERPLNRKGRQGRAFPWPVGKSVFRLAK